MGGTTPTPPPVESTPHLSSIHQSQLMRDHVSGSIKVSSQRGTFKLLPPSWRTIGILSVMTKKMLC